MAISSLFTLLLLVTATFASLNHTTKEISIATFNVHGFSSSSKYLHESISDHGGVWMLQEHWLSEHQLAYRYDNKYRIINEFQIRPDFYLPEVDVYIEFWGLEDKPAYQERKQEKQAIYQRYGLNLVELTNKEVERLDDHFQSTP